MMEESLGNRSPQTSISNKKPPLSPRPQSASPKPPLYPSLFDCEPPASIRSLSSTRASGQKPKATKPRIRSSSVGRTPDLRARYWALLFENLRKAVDEIYQTCELDESELECEETILILENYTKDFRSLVKWLKLSRDLESSHRKPTSLAWEVRKSSPAKGFLKSLFSSLSMTMAKPYKGSSKSSIQPAHVNTSAQTEQSASVNKVESTPLTPTEVVKEVKEMPKVVEVTPEPITNVNDDGILIEVSAIINELVAKCEEEIEIARQEAVVPKKVDEVPLTNDSKPSKSAKTSLTNVSTSKNNVTNISTSRLTNSKGAASTGPTKTGQSNEYRKTTSATSSMAEKRLNNPATAGGFGRGKRIVSSQPAPRTNFVRRNQINAGTKPTPSLSYTYSQPSIPSKVCKDEKKTGSTSSISSSSSCHSWADKVKGISSLDNSQSETISEAVSVSPSLEVPAPPKVTPSEDNDGWETVHRGRTRSRNSPVKKAPSESNLATALSTVIVCDKSTKLNTAVKRLSEVRSNSDLVTLPPRTKGGGIKTTSTSQVVNKKPFLTGKVNEKSLFNKPLARQELKTSHNNAKPKSVLVSSRVIDNKSATNKISVYKEGKMEVSNSSSSLKIRADSKPRVGGAIKTRKESSPKESTDKFSEKVDELDEIEIPVGSVKNEVLLESVLTKSEVAEEISASKISKDDKEFEDPAIICKIMSNSQSDSEKLDPEDGAENENQDEEEKSTDKNEIPSSDIEDELKLFEDCDNFDNDDELSDDWLERKKEQEDMVHEMGLSWGEQMDKLDLELRTPGRALQVHEKLSSPFKKRTLSETIRLQEEKQAKAQELREKLLVEKKQKLIGKGKKAEEIKAQMEEQLEQMRITMENKLQKAEEKRKMQLRNRVRKAKDEEDKVNEIAFINTLEAQNKRHDLLSREKDHEARLTEIQEERLRKLEEKAAKEAAAEERRKALEAERQARLLEMQEKRKLRDMKIEQQQHEKEKERQEMANQKALIREQRLSALNAAQEANVAELQKKIQHKLEETTRRHGENIEQIRQKAFELNVCRYSSNNDDAPRLVPYETKKMCTLCNVLIGSEVYLLSHLRGKKHQEAVKDQHQGMELPTEALELYNLKHIVDATADRLDPEITLDKERQKALKKRCKKIRQRMINRGSEWEKENVEKNKITPESNFKQKFQKNVKDIRKLLSALSSSSWENNTITSLERSLGEFERSLEKGKKNDQLSFRGHGGLVTLVQLLILSQNNDVAKIIPNKSLVRACLVYKLACQNCFENCLHTLHDNKIVTLLDLLTHRLNGLLPNNNNPLYSSGPDFITVAVPIDSVAGALLEAMSVIMTFIQQRPTSVSEMNEIKDLKLENETSLRIQDVVSYTVSMGIVDKLSHYLKNVQAPLDSEPQACDFILQILGFLIACAKLVGSRYDSVFLPKKEDNSQLLATFRVTELAGAVSLLYGTLLHSGAPSRGETKPPQLSQLTEAVTLTALRMLNQLALLDIQLVQSVLGSEGLSLQLRHISSYLLWYCSHWNSQSILHEVILLVGYFAVMNPDNQTIIQSGQRPSVLQQLCSLPFQYFSDPDLTRVLFPTLIACCYEHLDNKVVLEQDMSCELLSNFLEASLLDIHQGNVSNNAKSKESQGISDEEVRWCLSSRFPKSKWTAAKQFFSTSSC